MPELRLRQCQRQEQVQTLRQVLIVGGATRSIFPRLEWLLQNNKEYRDALAYISARKTVGRYRSVIDFLFCELFPNWRSSCFRYYADKGEMLRDIIDEHEQCRYEGRMLQAMEVAVTKYREKSCKSWKEFLGYIDREFNPG